VKIKKSVQAHPKKRGGGALWFLGLITKERRFLNSAGADWFLGKICLRPGILTFCLQTGVGGGLRGIVLMRWQTSSLKKHFSGFGTFIFRCAKFIEVESLG